MIADFREVELPLTCRIAVLFASGFRPYEARRKLGATDTEFRKARLRLERVAERLDYGGVEAGP